MPSFSQGFGFVVLPAPEIDEAAAMQLAEMGFPLEACRKAVYYTGNMGPEMAFNWIIAHMEEPGRRESKHRSDPVAPGYSFSPHPISNLSTLFTLCTVCVVISVIKRNRLKSQQGRRSVYNDHFTSGATIKTFFFFFLVTVMENKKCKIDFAGK